MIISFPKKKNFIVKDVLKEYQKKRSSRPVISTAGQQGSSMEITGRELLFSLTQQMNAIPRVKGQFPGEAPGKLSGQMAFADGTQEDFSISTVLTIGQRVYYSPEAQTQLENIRDRKSVV